MPTYKLYYFDARGRAEVARLMFAAKGQAFEDVRMKGEEWAKFKPQTPFGQLPMLDVDGRKIAQSIAIFNYVARKLGYYGKNDEEAAVVDQLVQTVSDMTNELIKFTFEKDEAKKTELQTKFFTESVPKYLGIFSKILKDGKGYMVGSSLSLGDIIVFDSLSSLETNKPGVLDKYPDIKSHINKIGEIPNIKKYIANRPVTNF